MSHHGISQDFWAHVQTQCNESRDTIPDAADFPFALSLPTFRTVTCASPDSARWLGFRYSLAPLVVRAQTHLTTGENGREVVGLVNIDIEVGVDHVEHAGLNLRHDRIRPAGDGLERIDDVTTRVAVTRVEMCRISLPGFGIPQRHRHPRTAVCILRDLNGSVDVAVLGRIDVEESSLQVGCKFFGCHLTGHVAVGWRWLGVSTCSSRARLLEVRLPSYAISDHAVVARLPTEALRDAGPEEQGIADDVERCGDSILVLGAPQLFPVGGAVGLQGAVERPFDVKFGPDGAMYIVDYGAVRINPVRVVRDKARYDWPPGTGITWRVTRTGG